MDSMSLEELAREALRGRTQGPWMHGRRDGVSWIDSKPDLAVVDIADRIENYSDAELITLAPELAEAVVRIATVAESLEKAADELTLTRAGYVQAPRAVAFEEAAQQIREALQGDTK